MLWEIKEYFRKLFSMTIRPAMKNLFSSKKSAVGMLCAMLILQTLLSVICITGVENIATQRDILNDHNANLASYEESAEEETTVSENTDSNSGTAASEEGRLLSSEVSAALSGAPIFAGFLSLWVITAVIVYQRISSASADRDKYMWGMYVTYGAQRKKIKNILKYELYTVLAVATVPAYFIALKLCNLLVSSQGYKYAFEVIPFLLVLLISYICIRLVVSYEVKLIGRRSCTELLKEEEGPSKLSRPKRAGRLRLGFSPFRYAVTSFAHLRKYYIALALAAAVPAIIWICCQTAAYSQNQYLSSEIKEYKITFKYGISEKDIETIFSKELSEIKGVSSVSASASYPADEISMFMLADISQYKSDADGIIDGYEVYADGDAMLAYAGQPFKTKTGFSPSVPQGSVSVIIPSDDTSYSFEEGQNLCVAVSRLDGKIRVGISDVNARLEEDLSEEYEYRLFKINKISNMRRTLASSNFLNIECPYFVFHEKDYEKITSISTDSFEQKLSSSAVSFNGSINADGSFELVLFKEGLVSLPSAGDSIRLNGQASYDITLQTEEGETLNKLALLTFDTARINSVTDDGDNLRINVSPKASVTMKPDMTEPTVIHFGLPSQILSDTENSIYIQHDMREGALTVSATYITLDLSESILYTDPAVRSADAGTHLKLGAQNLSDTAKENKLFLEHLYASNLFDIVCGDSMTSAALETDITIEDTGSTIIILPTGYAYDFDFKIGDTVRINRTNFDVSLYESENWQLDDAKERLSKLMGEDFEYIKLKITDIIYRDSIEKPMVIVSGDDFASAMNIDAPYTRLDVYLDNGIDSERYAALNDSIKYELQKIYDLKKDKNYNAKITSTGAFLDFMLKKNANYGLWISVIGILVPMTLPFIWYYPLATLFERRKHDYITLKNLGKKKSKIRAIFIFEGLMAALTALLAISVLCYPCMFIFDFVCFFFELPIDFNISFLTPATFLLACTAGVACVALSFIICYFIAAPRNPKKSKSIKEKADGNT